MADSSMKIFYGDYSRNDEDPTMWMQSLNTKRVANDWMDAKTIDIFESLLAEEKKAYRWWHDKLKSTHPTMDRKDWAAVRKEFKKQWPPLPEPEEDTESKREELEQMRLRDDELSTKVTYQGQELYTHVAFANEAAHLANEIGDTNSFLLQTVRNQLPEAVRNMLKSLGKKPKTWDKFRKAMITIPLSDLREEAAKIAKRDSFYAEVAALQIRLTGQTPVTARATFQPRQTLTQTPNWLSTPQMMLPGMPPSRYQTQPAMPWTPIHNKPPMESQPQNSPSNLFQPTPQASRNLFRMPAMGTNAMPIGRARETSTDQFSDWDQHNPYPRTTEGKAAYKAAMQAWWERNGFNA